MKPQLFRHAFLAILLLLYSCGEPVKTVLGDWIWVESTGGLLPAVTPENSGQTARLNLSRNYWTYYENGQETERFAIKINRSSQGLIIKTNLPEGDKIVKFINDDEITVTWYGGKNSDCQDCVVRRFIRAAND
jgi:hypothetical protein